MGKIARAEIDNARERSMEGQVMALVLSSASMAGSRDPVKQILPAVAGVVTAAVRDWYLADGLVESVNGKIGYYDTLLSDAVAVTPLAHLAAQTFESPGFGWGYAGASLLARCWRECREEIGAGQS